MCVCVCVCVCVEGINVYVNQTKTREGNDTSFDMLYIVCNDTNCDVIQFKNNSKQLCFGEPSDITVSCLVIVPRYRRQYFLNVFLPNYLLLCTRFEYCIVSTLINHFRPFTECTDFMYKKN